MAAFQQRKKSRQNYELHRDTSKDMRCPLHITIGNIARFSCIAGGQRELNTHRLMAALNGYADFHSNRHTFITNLSLVGVSPRDAQELARHSNIRLTMGVYSHLGLQDKARAIGKLAAVGG